MFNFYLMPDVVMIPRWCGQIIDKNPATGNPALTGSAQPQARVAFQGQAQSAFQ